MGHPGIIPRLKDALSETFLSRWTVTPVLERATPEAPTGAVAWVCGFRRQARLFSGGVLCRYSDEIFYGLVFPFS